MLLPLYLFGTLLVTAFAVAVIVFLVIQKQRQVRNRLARQRLEFHYSQSLLNTKIEVQETTLKMLSQELHDNVNQVLSTGFMQISSAETFMANAEGKELIVEAKRTLKMAIKDLRLLSHSLNTAMVEHRETEEAIENELSRIRAFSNITCTLDSDSTHDLGPEKKLLVFRIVQEALQNVIKHAQAKNIAVTIQSTEKIFELKITDDGVGFNPQDARIATSMGMMNIKERVSLLKGAINVISAPNAGTTLDLRIPIT